MVTLNSLVIQDILDHMVLQVSKLYVNICKHKVLQKVCTQSHGGGAGPGGEATQTQTYLHIRT